MTPSPEPVAEQPTDRIAFTLTDQQRAFFETFGFLKIPGIFSHEIGRIIEGFEEVFEREQPHVMDPENSHHQVRSDEHRDQPRLIIPGIVDKSEKLSWLRTDPRIVGVVSGLVGDDYSYAESDGNLFNCELSWHLDTYGATGGHQYVKLYFYLDALGPDTGALRMMPGTHLHGPYAKTLRRGLANDPAQALEAFGVDVSEIPSWAIAVEPGDLVVGDFRTMHGSFKGQPRRRLFTINFRGPRIAAAAEPQNRA